MKISVCQESSGTCFFFIYFFSLSLGPFWFMLIKSSDTLVSSRSSLRRVVPRTKNCLLLKITSMYFSYFLVFEILCKLEMKDGWNFLEKNVIESLALPLFIPENYIKVFHVFIFLLLLRHIILKNMCIRIFSAFVLLSFFHLTKSLCMYHKSF